MKFRRLVVWLMISSFLLARIEVLAQSHEQGVAAGTAANAVIRGLVNAPSATAVVPGYTNAPPQTTYAGRPSLGADASAKLAACALTPNDPICQALRTAVNSANTPRPAIGASDPAVAAASRIVRNPSAALGSLASYYSGCTTSELVTPQHSESRSCTRHVGVGSYSCSNRLSVAIQRTANCSPGDWFAHAAIGSTGLDVQCMPDRPAAAQHFRITSGTSALAYFDVDMGLPVTFPSMAVVIGRSIGQSGSPIDTGVWLTDKKCTGESCTLAVAIADAWHEQCNYIGGDAGGFVCTKEPPFLGTSTGWERNPAYGAMPEVRLNFTLPTLTTTASDHWVEDCPTLPQGGRCTAAKAPICVDGPATRSIDGVAVTRDCWERRYSLSCDGVTDADSCASLAIAGCRQAASTCAQSNPVTGLCEVFRDSYDCPIAAESTTVTSKCPNDVFCIGGGCFDIRSAHDADFGRSLSMLEAGREAGVYLDTDRMRVFTGEAGDCRVNTLKSCCGSDGAGAGMTNQSLFGTGSRLVYDMLMDSGNREFITQGIAALLTSGGFSGSLSAYGFTVAVNGTALPAGSTVLYSSSSVAGEGVVVAFDPWTLAIAIIIYVVLTLVSCNEEEARLSLKEGAHLCHTVGSYCSDCIRHPIFGCIACRENTFRKCCFNSVISRIINEQGRLQIGKAWGSAENPDCSGFTVAQLRTLDFAAMDLTEFYASLVPAGTDLTALQQRNASKVAACYYGAGRCD